jgi:hypothetical protein
LKDWNECIHKLPCKFESFGSLGFTVVGYICYGDSQRDYFNLHVDEISDLEVISNPHDFSGPDYILPGVNGPDAGHFQGAVLTLL